MLPGKNKRRGAVSRVGGRWLCPMGWKAFPVEPMTVSPPCLLEKRKPPLNKNVQRRFLIIDE